MYDEDLRLKFTVSVVIIGFTDYIKLEVILWVLKEFKKIYSIINASYSGIKLGFRLIATTL